MQREKTEFDGLSINELDLAQSNYHWRHYMNGGSSEFDGSINDILRAKIEAYAKEHTEIYLARINDYDKHGPNPDIQFTRYTGQLIYNFQFDIVVPCEDEELRRLLNIHNTEGKKEDGILQGIEAIFSRIHELGGIQLYWV